MASAMGMGIINYPKPRRGDRFCARKNGANRAAAPSGANGLDANISHGLRAYAVGYLLPPLRG